MSFKYIWAEIVCVSQRQGKSPVIHTRPAKAIKGNFRKGVTLLEWQQRKLILAAAWGKDWWRKSTPKRRPSPRQW